MEKVKSLNIDLPESLYKTYSKICIDHGITKTEGIKRCIEYLDGQNKKFTLLMKRENV